MCWIGETPLGGEWVSDRLLIECEPIACRLGVSRIGVGLLL